MRSWHKKKLRLAIDKMSQIPGHENEMLPQPATVTEEDLQRNTNIILGLESLIDFANRGVNEMSFNEEALVEDIHTKEAQTNITIQDCENNLHNVSYARVEVNAKLKTSKNLLDTMQFLEHKGKLKGHNEPTSHKLREAEDNIQKNAQGIACHSNLLREHNKDKNTFISTNVTFTNQFHALETKSEDFLKYLQVERQRIDNVESGLNGLDETVQKALPDIKRNTDRIDELDARQTNLGKNLEQISNQVQDNVKEIASLKQVLGNQNSNLGDIEERLKQIENQIKYKFG